MSAIFSTSEDYVSSSDKQVAQLRIPPHSQEAESSVLGGLLLDNNSWDKVADLLVEADFYRYEHRLVFASITSLVNANRPADVITVFEQMQSQGKAEEIGGLADITGVPTGFFDLDRMTSGMQAGDLLVLAARPSMGKTALAINIAEHVALHEDLPVAVFSMEMGASQLAIRIVGSIGRIDQGRLRTGKLIDDEWPRLSDAIERLKTVSLSIDETPGLTTSELRASARRLARSCGKLGLVVVDYLQLMSGSGGGDGENRATELGEISRGLKMLAKELQCPVIALSQLNRGVEQRTDKRPMMSDLRESGAIEQDADVIMFIYRDDYYNKDSKEPGVAEIIIAKQRNGPTGTVKLTFLKPITKFESYAGASSDY